MAQDSPQDGLRAWICVALPGDAPETFTMRRQDGTQHTLTAAQLAEIAQANATEGAPGVIILDR
jgi:hypothetical protein